MSIETQVNPVPFPPAKGVDVDKIEKQLAAMWSEASDAENGEEAAGLTRACALNLIVYATPEDDRNQLEEILSQVSQQHPGRILILVAHRETEEPKLEAYVSMNCRTTDGSGKQICGEQVTIEAAGALVETAGSAVVPLLVPDVPVFLWWDDIPHYEDKLFDRLAQTADRIIIDSASFDHPYDDLLRLRQVIGDESRKMRVSDLNWGRLTHWRTLLASFWDVPDYRPVLDQIDRVAVAYRPPSAAPHEVTARALLLVGWLSSRLGWEVTGAAKQIGESVIECGLKAGDREIVLALKLDETADHNDGLISSVAVSANKLGAEFSVALRAAGTKLETAASLGAEHSVGRLLSYEMRSDAERLSRELAFLSRDAIYEEAMAQGAQLVEAIRAQ